MKNDKTHIRAFIAISLPEEIKLFLKGLQKSLNRSGIRPPQVSWSKPDTLHLTLRFLGNVDIRNLDMIKRGMVTVAKGTPVHSLCASGIGVFPSIKNTRVIWAGIRGQTDVLKKLVSRLELALREQKVIKMDTAKFSPHLTLARVKRSISSQAMARVIREYNASCSNDFFVSEMTLFQSMLSRSGAIHKKIFTAALACTEDLEL